MPIYKFRCTKCQTSAEVLRTFDEYQIPPKEDEVSHIACDHEWEREIGKTSVVRSWNWGGGKGNWLVLFGILSLGMLGDDRTSLTELSNGRLSGAFSVSGAERDPSTDSQNTW